MSSLSVVEFKNGQAQPNATVQLDGPSGRKAQNTNGAGAVTFADLMPGKHIVNAALLGEFLGTGFYNLPAGGGGVIHIKYPQTPVEQEQDDKKGTLSVSVYWLGANPHAPQLVDCAEVRLAGPTFKSSLTKA